MAESDDSPLPKFRRKHVPPDPSRSTTPPESSPNLIVKRPAFKRTPPEPHRVAPSASSRSSFLGNPLLDLESKEVRSDGETNSSVSEYSSDDDDVDDSCVTHGSYSDGSPGTYRQGQLSQAENFTTPMHLARHRGRVLLYEELEARIKAEKAQRRSARLAAEAAAAQGALLAIPLPNVEATPAQIAPLDTPVPNAAQHIDPVLSAIPDTSISERQIIIPLMFQRSRKAELLPLRPNLVPSLRSPAADPLSLERRIIPETPPPVLPSLPLTNSSSGKLSRMKLTKTVRSVAVQTQPLHDTASAAAQTTTDVDSPVTLRELQSELHTLSSGFKEELKNELHALLKGLGF